jgi:hypothetical protein
VGADHIRGRLPFAADLDATNRPLLKTGQTGLTEANGWTIQLCQEEMYGIFMTYEFRKDDMIVIFGFLEMTYGDDPIVCSKNRSHLESFLKDFHMEAQQIKKDRKVTQRQ